MNIKQFITKGTPTGYFDYTGEEFKVGDKVEYIDSEGFPCETEIIVDSDFWTGIEGWDRMVGISDMENSNYRVVCSSLEEFNK